MPDKATEVLTELRHVLRGRFTGEIRVDPVTRRLYATDASIYQVEPLGVAFPRTTEDLESAVEACAGLNVPVLARGSGSSLAGQAIGPALILDCTRNLNRLLEVNLEERTAWVETGLVLEAFNLRLKSHGLQFGPDPASAERATLGGSIANNAAGAHSIVYGMAADHLLGADVVLADGASVRLEAVSLTEAMRRASQARGDIERRWYAAALKIRGEYAEAIRRRWPMTFRRASGYSLNYLLPWSPMAPPCWDAGEVYPPLAADQINLASLLAGSEGTLAVIKRLQLRLAPLPKATILVVLAFSEIWQACDVVPSILDYGPSAIELIPGSLVRLARSIPAYAPQVSFLDAISPPAETAPALLVVEFNGESAAEVREKAQALKSLGPHLLAEAPGDQRRVWNVRKVGLGIFLSRPGKVKPWSFIEDLAVPVERLGAFGREIDRLLGAHGTTAEVYGHASAGCLHFRPLLDLQTVSGVKELREIAVEAVELTLQLGGSVSGEHGDGLARSEWLERMYGEEILAAFHLLKQAADPRGLLNPGKIVGSGADVAPPRMDENLRFGADYQAQHWLAGSPEKLVFDYSWRGGLSGAIEQCNGAGVCRKDSGVMCPSFQASREELHSTRGRANLLRALISGAIPAEVNGEEAVFEALSQCLACKGCLSECPSAVDMARLKYEFLNAYYQSRRRPWRDYLFGYIGEVARLAHPLAGLINPLLRLPGVGWVGERTLGLARERVLPHLKSQSLSSLARRERLTEGEGPWVLFLSDPFTDYFYPEVGLQALRLLRRAGNRVHVLPVSGSGRTLISKGFLDAARKQAERVVRAIKVFDPQGRWPVVGVEPSEIYTLMDEYPDLVRREVAGSAELEALKRRAWSMEELLIRPIGDGAKEPGKEVLTRDKMRIAIIDQQKPLQTNSSLQKPNVLLHVHCYQKARPPASDGLPVGAEASIILLEACGYAVKVIDAGCCGMAGAFGYEREHYALSMQIGDLKLFPAVRKAEPETIVAAAGISCRAQIEDGAGREAIHPIMLI